MHVSDLSQLSTLLQAGSLFETVCDGCGTQCPRCIIPGETPECTVVLDHTRSNGGYTTIDELMVDSEYWRATATSEDILACYNPDACLGGVTGTTEYCDEGYQGPCEERDPMYASFCSV